MLEFVGDAHRVSAGGHTPLRVDPPGSDCSSCDAKPTWQTDTGAPYGYDSPTGWGTPEGVSALAG
ncbi:hypothetical protein [Streptomyces sp. NPDC001450]